MNISLKTMLLDVHKTCYMKKITSMIAHFAAVANMWLNLQKGSYTHIVFCDFEEA